MSPDLSRRLADVLAEHFVTPDERGRIQDAARNAEDWSDLPADVRRLVFEIEARPAPQVRL